MDRTTLDEYQHFFIDTDIETEAPNFLRNGHFSSSLGDAMPLGMANVLQMSIFILAPQHLIPFISIFPRYNVESISPLMLAFDNHGPGHYDALIERVMNHNHVDDSVIDTRVDCDQNTYMSVEHVKSSQKVQDSYCRCGINTKQQSVHNVVPQRAYKSRCKCINKHSRCSLKCKCLGNCGNTDCKKNAKTTEDKKETTSRSSRKRGKHQIDTTPNKYLKLSPSKNDGLNMLEYFIIVAIVSFFVSEGLETLPDNYKQMTAMFNNIVKTILEEENLMFLPVAIHSERVIARTVRKIQRKKKDV